MADTSTYLGLNLPVGSDTFDHDKFLRQNFEKIDKSLSEKVNIKNKGVKPDGTDCSSAIQAVFNTCRNIVVPEGVYKCDSPLNVPVGTSVTFSEGAVFDLTALTTGVGFTSNVGNRLENLHLRYSNEFDGEGFRFTTKENQSSTSVNNIDTNKYIVKNLTIEKVMPTTGIAWDWYTNAKGTAFVAFGEDNPDVAITSGFWGALVDNLMIKGVWLQSGLIKDDGTAWITSSTVRRVTMDGPRRGFEIVSGNTAAPKTGTLTLHDFHMQGMRWTKSGETDVITEWMLKADATVYCDFKNWFPQDFSGTHLIQNFIQFTVNSKWNSFESSYIVNDTDIQDLGTSNGFTTAFGRKFPNRGTSNDTRTLDWYEEGTFTPTSLGSTTAGAVTYTSQSGVFTRIGKRVFFTLEIGWSAHTGTGNLRIGGLPYTSHATDAASVMNVLASSLAYGASGQVSVLLGKGTKNMDIYLVTNDGSAATVAVDTSVGVLRITGHYTV